MTTERKQINFTIVPDDTEDLARTYANFCAISHTPFDFTLSFCEVLPLSERSTTEIRSAAAALWTEAFESKLVRIVDDL
jgi:hypothetical protein